MQSIQTESESETVVSDCRRLFSAAISVNPPDASTSLEARLDLLPLPTELRSPLPLRKHLNICNSDIDSSANVRSPSELIQRSRNPNEGSLAFTHESRHVHRPTSSAASADCGAFDETSFLNFGPAHLDQLRTRIESKLGVSLTSPAGKVYMDLANMRKTNMCLQVLRDIKKLLSQQTSTINIEEAKPAWQSISTWEEYFQYAMGHGDLSSLVRGSYIAYSFD
jgi:hypothetical protein